MCLSLYNKYITVREGEWEMPDNDKTSKRATDKRLVPFRIETETAEKIRTLSKDFSNQHAALNAIIAAYERENLMMANSQFSGDIRQFGENQKFLSGNIQT